MIESLIGKKLKKVCAGFNYSMFLTTRGQLLSCGQEKFSGLNDPALSKYHRPQQIPFLENVTVIDVSCGDRFTVALSDCGLVYAWGTNTNGQLGLDPEFYGQHVQLPTLINDISLQSNPIQQISAGSNHWAAWTTPPLPSQSKAGPAPNKISMSTALSAAFTTMTTSSPFTCHLGMPSKVPAKYQSLVEFPVPQLRKRLYILKQVSQLVESTWRSFPNRAYPMSQNIQHWTHQNPTTSTGTSLRSDNIRQMMESKLSLLPLAQTLQRTMVQGRNYGPQVTVNRLQSSHTHHRKRMETGNRYQGLETGRNYSTIFAQISSQVATMDPLELRLPGRSWKVKLIGEGADDAGGVFDDTVTEMCRELTRGLQEGTNELDLLIRAPNCVNDVGLNRDKYLLNADDMSDQKKQHFWFLGALLGVAVRTRKPIAISFAPIVWKLICNCATSFKDLEDVDYHYSKVLKTLFEYADTEDQFENVAPTDDFRGITFTGHPVDLNKTPLKLTFKNRHSYVARAVQQRLEEMLIPATYIRSGFAAIVPMPIIEMMPTSSLELLVCGMPNISISALKRVARYR